MSGGEWLVQLTRTEPTSLTHLKNVVVAASGWAPDSFSVAVEALILNRDGKLLILERGARARDENGKLEGVGGQVENDDLRAEVAREVQEEIGSEVQLGKIEFLELKSDVIADSGKRWVIASYICEYVSGKPQIMEPGKIDAIHWLEPLGIPEERLTSSCRQSVASLAEYLQRN